MILGALAGAATTAAGNWMANQANQNLAQGQQNWNQSMWEQQNQYNTEQWNREQQRSMSVYERERGDQLEFWKLQNEYNSPQSQMARYKEAGLNPHLIYGQGNNGNASPIPNPTPNQTGIDKSDIKPYSRAQADSVTRGIDVFGQTNQFKNLEAQTDNLRAQENVIQQEALLKAQQTAATALGIETTKFDYGIAKDLRDTSIDAAKINLEQQKQNLARGSQDMEHTGVKIDRDKFELQFAKDMRDPRIRQAIANIEATIKNNQGRDLNNALDRERLELRKMGIQDGDGIIWRTIAKNWDVLTNESKAIYKSLPQWYKSIITPWK